MAALVQQLQKLPQRSWKAPTETKQAIISGMTLWSTTQVRTRIGFLLSSSMWMTMDGS